MQTETVDTLKKLAALAGVQQNMPVRKANLVEYIKQRMAGENLQVLWQRLDTLQQAAVAETAHGPSPCFDAERFVAKYGQLPKWGEKEFYKSNPSLLGLFFYSRSCRMICANVLDPSSRNRNRCGSLRRMKFPASGR